MCVEAEAAGAQIETTNIATVYTGYQSFKTFFFSSLLILHNLPTTAKKHAQCAHKAIERMWCFTWLHFSTAPISNTASVPSASAQKNICYCSSDKDPWSHRNSDSCLRGAKEETVVRLDGSTKHGTLTLFICHHQSMLVTWIIYCNCSWIFTSLVWCFTRTQPYQCQIRKL